VASLFTDRPRSEKREILECWKFPSIRAGRASTHLVLNSGRRYLRSQNQSTTRAWKGEVDVLFCGPSNLTMLAVSLSLVI
jgi:hypothetical protein